MKVLVTGASGLLGKKLVTELLANGHQVIAIYNRNPVPIEDPSLEKYRIDISDTVLLEDLILKKRPGVIVHAAAYTDVDGCERDKKKAWLVNVEATRSIVRAARVVRAHLIYISTDYVFDGERGYYKETDIPNPVNYYGLTKLIAEELVGSSDLLYTIVRPSAIYGIGGSKKSFAEYVAEKLSKGEKVYALVDQYVSPTLNTLLAKAVAEIVDMRPMGIFHVAGERMSRYEFAIKIAEKLNLPVDLVEKASINDMKHWLARRPRDSSLDTSKARRLLKTRFYDTNLALELFRNEWTAKTR
ncbi:dTDP-4-dehydrorhamnose reductase [Desulfurococcaceae archaeon MEX13E-LK6-19]|nr:dTDP-4-dehydrorhamnose reductase [Desulfurococcaceae archaeon MEX13E-LK6-19]